MISKETILKQLENFINQNPETFGNKEIFIIEIKVSNDNKIQILLDSLQGISIDDCVSVSREFEKLNNRETEDYEISVSSYGIDKPLKSAKQYLKYIGKTLKIETNDKQNYKATLVKADEQNIIISETKKQKIKESKKKETITTETKISISNIKSAKPVIKF